MTSEASGKSGSMALRVGVVLVALAVTLVILGLLEAPERPEPLPQLPWVDASGKAFDAPAWRVPWVGTVRTVGAERAPKPAAEVLASLRAALPAGVPLFLFSRVDEKVEGVNTWVGSAESMDRLRAFLGTLATDPASSGFAAFVVDHTGRVRDRSTVGPAGNRVTLSVLNDQIALARRPALHATLNGTSALLLVAGFLLIRRKRIVPHLTCMLGAAVVTLAFLLSYLQYHAEAGSVGFSGSGWLRVVYLAILITHTVLAAFVVPMFGLVLWHAARRRFDEHRGAARWTLPLWLYVSVTGVVIYFMLYGGPATP